MAGGAPSAEPIDDSRYLRRRKPKEPQQRKALLLDSRAIGVLAAPDDVCGAGKLLDDRDEAPEGRLPVAADKQELRRK